jgi:hypothetical protein
VDANLWGVRFTAPLDAAQPQRVDRAVVALLAQQPGFRGYCAFPVGEREGVVVSLWATQADAARALERVTPVTQPIVRAPVAGPPERAGGEGVRTRRPDGAAPPPGHARPRPSAGGAGRQPDEQGRQGHRREEPR